MGIILRWRNINYMLETDIFRNYSQKDLGVLRDDFKESGCPNDSQASCRLRLSQRACILSASRGNCFTLTGQVTARRLHANYLGKMMKMDLTVRPRTKLTPCLA